MDAAPALVLVGAGKMGGALLGGWLAAGVEPGTIGVVEPEPSDALKNLAAEKGFALNPAPAPARTMVLAIKPQMLDAAAPGLAPFLDADSLLISILAGKTVANLASRLPARAIVRAMPNTPAAIGRGITGAFAIAQVTPAQRETAQELLSGVGAVEWVSSEQAIDVVTAISGSGPAYVFLLVEALAKGGEALGLPPDLAMRLARATVEGSGELLHLSPEISAEILRKNVTSPGGTTQAALDVLMADDGLAALMARATAAAAKRAEELAG
ncbi:pyrroline-5-carboxylate reductase [Rhodoblastus acidophilus]|uniref:Pyrroline-5-carboxylate reductase n=1 Tax=Candidatus Rhodoblastus alkanivorans TaxID=2954117 RepID=A0ABS9ZA15_9HYPH|nr:pyrroline-5-carboxylate reductase [Candidatus Rhodoblastus alkanivorans]MCI4678881.1 pyrroline-5-carboxylate reductase [Candidatus Rhodoblastus alkanivorans]MCI4684195.1 pyrroline-5-carboxylate reductase [Candidatus Rhodoblastus alkanivorans]MDI4641516.1 pyrroline-5-carboxylate reductase [Rhodoblastus acidophilus]